jgi:hypothetical protein
MGVKYIHKSRSISTIYLLSLHFTYIIEAINDNAKAMHNWTKSKAGKRITATGKPLRIKAEVAHKIPNEGNALIVLAIIMDSGIK